MKYHPTLIFLTTALSLSAATTRYVNINSANPVPPFTEWATAATNIQDAVDAAVEGDEIVVTNGVYATGGRAVGTNLLVNRVAVDKPLTVRSVNGPAVTIIRGNQAPGTTNGDGAIRCVYLTNGAMLSGFTLTNGATLSTGDVNYDQSGGGVFCESVSAVVSNCVIVNNSARSYGGGSHLGTVYNCVLENNSAGTGGGGAALGVLWNCTVTGNWASTYGGGTFNVSLINCTLTGNRSWEGGGAYQGGLVVNCIIYYNTASSRGANDPGANYTGSSLSFCCTIPMPTAGSGNFTTEPQLASATHLSAQSPCRNAGNPANASGVDIDGEVWNNPPAIGCDELRPGEATGPLSVAIRIPYTTVAKGFALSLTAEILGRTTGSRWDFGDGTTATNRPYLAHAWSAPGDYLVTLRAFNDSEPGGISATVLVQVAESAHFVAADSSNPVAPFTSWETAARTIQDAVDAASVPGTIIWVTNGVYDTGGRAVNVLMTNRVAVTLPLRIESINGPAVTQIVGYQVPGTTNGDSAVRCVYLVDGAALSGFTLTNGATRNVISLASADGGGVWCESSATTVSNCVISGNSALWHGGGAYLGFLERCILSGNNNAQHGGGMFGGILKNSSLIANSATLGGSGGGANSSLLYNCILTANRAFSGGGAFFCTLFNCTVSSNSTSRDGGGVSSSTLNNCILYFNTRDFWAVDNYSGATLNYCCTTPLPQSGVGNLSRDPLFINRTNGNLRLQTNSPCINAGNNAFAPGSTDLDGNPRIVGGTVDIGAYEFQTPASQLSYAWLQQYGLPTDGSADFTDPDADRANNWQEWQSATIPTNALSALRLLTPQTIGTNLVVTWQSVTNKAYYLERSTGLGANASFLPLASNLVGQAGTTTFTDINAAPAGPRFYRVGVQ